MVLVYIILFTLVFFQDYPNDPHQLNLTIQCTNEEAPFHYSTMILYIKVIDINDNYPIFTEDTYVVEIEENKSASKMTIIQVKATDNDSVSTKYFE